MSWRRPTNKGTEEAFAFSSPFPEMQEEIRRHFAWTAATLTRMVSATTNLRRRACDSGRDVT